MTYNYTWQTLGRTCATTLFFFAIFFESQTLLTYTMNTENEITNLSVNEKVASEIEQTQTEVQVGVDASAQPEASDVSHVKFLVH